MRVERPGAVGRVFQQLRVLYGRERILLIAGSAGIFIGVACLLYAAAFGRYIPPEGDLLKPATFDIALGTYVLTLALFAPFARFTPAGHRRWAAATAGVAFYGYAIETVQQFRGLDPRFSQHASPAEQLAGFLFLITALTLIPLFGILAVKLWRRSAAAAGRLLLTALGYATASVSIGFGSGIWMSMLGGSRFGAADILPIHAMGFHGLQAVPIVAVLLVWAGSTSLRSRGLVHVGGVAWIVACAAVLWQTARGLPIREAGFPVYLATAALGIWMIVLLRAVGAWRAANWDVPVLLRSRDERHGTSLPLQPELRESYWLRRT